MQLFKQCFLVFIATITITRSQHPPRGFKLAEGGSSTVIQVPRPPRHPVFDEPRQFRYMEHDQMIPGYILAVMNFTIVSISPNGDMKYLFVLNGTMIRPEYTNNRTFIYKAIDLPKSSIRTFMQSTSSNDSNKLQGELLHIPITYNHCIITFNRLLMSVSDLSLPCKLVIRKREDATPAGPLSEFRFLWPRQLLAKQTDGNNRVLSFYVSSPFNNSISLVDLTTDSVTDIYMCCSAVPEKKCYGPSFMAWTPYNSLVVTTTYGIFKLEPSTGHLELLTNQNRFRRSNNVLDGQFGTAQVGQLGPLTKVPGIGAVFVFADTMLHNLRVMDMNARQFYSLCLSSEDLYLTPESTKKMPGVLGLLPLCNLTSPNTVLFDQSGGAILVSQSHSINSLNLTLPNTDMQPRTLKEKVIKNEAGGQQTNILTQKQCIYIDGLLSALYYNPDLCESACQPSQKITCNSSSTDSDCSKLVQTVCPQSYNEFGSAGCSSLSVLSPPVYKHSWNLEIHTESDVDGCLRFTYTCISFLFDLTSITDLNGDGSLLSLQRLPYLSCKVSLWGLLVFGSVPAILMAVIITLMACDYKTKQRDRRNTSPQMLSTAGVWTTC